MQSPPLVPHSLWIEASSEAYPIHIGQRLLEQSQYFQPFVAGRSVLVLSHPDIATPYLSTILQTCQTAGVARVGSFLVPAGDQHKTLASAEKIWSFLLSQQFHRDTVIMTLGGGMLGDLGGFCASCYLRGVGLIHCPTTLLAQIDAAIGGKTAVNHRLGKNTIGAFYPPNAVIADSTVLTTLGQREYVSGLAELIKYGVTLDADLFAWLEENIELLLARHPEALAHAIPWACRLKAQVVTQDEKEQQFRMILNFGHTVGHAIESLMEYQGWLHGEAVAVGMCVAARLSWQRGLIHEMELERLIALLDKANLPTKLPIDLTLAQILAKIKQDKKHLHQELRWVLLNGIGQASFAAVPSEEVTSALKGCLEIE